MNNYSRRRVGLCSAVSAANQMCHGHSDPAADPTAQSSNITLSMIRHNLVIALVFFAGLAFLSCSSDENNMRPPPGSANTIAVDFENARAIDVDSDRHWALLLHTGLGDPGTALQLVDLSTPTLLASRLLTDYLELYDVKFIRDTLACFAGRPHGHIGYAVQFVSLPSLTLSTRVIVTPDTAGHAGFLAVDSTATFVYYSHAGGGEHDGVYKIRISNRTIVDADNDGVVPYALDNELVNGLFNEPGKIFYDRESQKLVVANLSDTYVTMIAASQWGVLDRAANLSFPIPGTSHLSTGGGPISDARATSMAYGAGVYVFAGIDNGQSYLGRFTVNSVGIDLLETLPGRTWLVDNANIRIHPREDIVSVFVLEVDTGGVAIGQFRLNNLVEVAGSPYRTRTIPDSVVTTFGLDISSDRLIVADSESPRLELIAIN